MSKWLCGWLGGQCGWLGGQCGGNVGCHFVAVGVPTNGHRRNLTKAPIARFLANGYQGCQKSDKAVVDTKKEIAQAHELGFTTVEMQFDSRADAIIWIIKNQFGRRNLSAYDRSILALKLKPVIAAKAKEKQGERTDILENSTKSSPINILENSTKSSPINTRLEIAKTAGVSDNTIAKVEKIEQQAAPEIKAALRSGDLSINAAYNKVQQAARKQDIQRQVEEIEMQTLEQPDGLFDVIVIDPPWGYIKQAHHGGFDANGRRNLSAYDRSILALKLKPVIAAKAKERMEEGKNQYTSPPQIFAEPSTTPQEKKK